MALINNGHKLTDVHKQLVELANTSPMALQRFRLDTDGTVSMPYAAPSISDIYGFPAEEIMADFSPVIPMLDAGMGQRRARVQNL